MATKTTQTTSTTLSNVNGKQSISTSSTISKRKLSNQERAQGGLVGIGRLGMIGITILAVSVGSAVDQFTTSDLIQTNPNYQLTNDYVGYTDPLNEINYIQYGQEVFDNVISFTQGFSSLGYQAKNLWDKLIEFLEADTTEVAVNFLVDFNRLLTNISTAQTKYYSLSASDKVVYGTFYNEIEWFVQWLYYSPTELTA